MFFSHFLLHKKLICGKKYLLKRGEKMKKTVYIKCEKATQLSKKQVCIGDVAKLWCDDKALLRRLSDIKLVEIGEDKKQVAVSVMYLISLMSQNEDIAISNIGESDFVINYVSEKKGRANKVTDIIKVALVSVIIFFGGAFAIMSYENDIDIEGIFENIYILVLGTNNSTGKILEVAYSIGVGAGIVVFYNHFLGMKFTIDPTPVTIEMKKYEEDISETMIEISKANKKELDVDGS